METSRNRDGEILQAAGRPGAGELEAGWALTGTDGRNGRLRLLIGESRLSQAYLGLTIGRHPALCELVVEDPTVSRRHARIGRDSDGLFVEDVNSLNGTVVDGQPLQPFTPTRLHEGQSLLLGEVVLTVERLAGGSAAGTADHRPEP